LLPISSVIAYQIATQILHWSFISHTQILNDELHPSRAFFLIMAALPHGGRIVPMPILTGLEQHQQFLDSTTPPPAVLENNCSQSTLDQTPLLAQPVDSEAMRRKKTLDLSSLEMPCLKERGLFALPTEGDGKLNIHIDLYNFSPVPSKLFQSKSCHF
jgi:hypothetical protein